MTDIVELLRSGYAATNFAHLKAADEIERNREAIAELVNSLKTAKDTTYSDKLYYEWNALITKHDIQPTKKGSN